jgi:putative pyruvate formate lyase activating enzyme
MFLMKLTRRDFIKKSIILGGSLLFYDNSLYAANDKRVSWSPAYEKLEKEGEPADRIEQAYSIFKQCELCPRQCGANRLNGEQGFCRASAKLVVYSAHPHYGEEISLVEKTAPALFSFQTVICVVFSARTGQSPTKDMEKRFRMKRSPT